MSSAPTFSWKSVNYEESREPLVQVRSATIAMYVASYFYLSVRGYVFHRFLINISSSGCTPTERFHLSAADQDLESGRSVSIAFSERVYRCDTTTAKGRGSWTHRTRLVEYLENDIVLWTYSDEISRKGFFNKWRKAFLFLHLQSHCSKRCSEASRSIQKMNITALLSLADVLHAKELVNDLVAKVSFHNCVRNNRVNIHVRAVS